MFGKNRLPSLCLVGAVIFGLFVAGSTQLVGQQKPAASGAAAAAAPPKSLAGRWAVTAYVLEQEKDEKFFLVDVSETAEGTLAGKVVESLDGKLQWSVKS